jgi:hypothetical protein
MSGRGALALALALAAWSGPARAGVRAPAPSEPGEAVEGGDAAADVEATTEPTDDDPNAALDGAAATTSAPDPRRSAATTREPARTHDVPADDFEAEPRVAPGGYYGHGVILERPPPDGRNRIIVGSILVPLGTLATVTSAVGTWLTVPAHCGRRLASAGIEADAARCQGLFTFNVIRTTYGALMLASGATVLALGIIQRERYRSWRRQHGMRAHLEPSIGPVGRGTATVGLRLRF